MSGMSGQWCGLRVRASFWVLALLVASNGGVAAEALRPTLDKLQESQATLRPTDAIGALTPGLTTDTMDATRRARYMSPDLPESDIDPDTYVLGPYDLLGVVLEVGDARTYQLAVLPEGVVVVPNVGVVPASGHTLTDFRAALRGAVAQRYRGFEIYCHLLRPRQFRIYVTGEVKEPGTLAARATERVSDVIERAGGLTEQASRREIELRDAQDRLLARVDLGRWLACGDLRANPVLQAGSVVHVPPRGRQVIITGEVRDAGTFELRRGESLTALLQLAGGPTTLADLSRVAVERTDSTGSVTVSNSDLHHESPATDDVTRVTILSALLGKNRVFFITPDDRQQTLYMAPGETLADLVRRTATLPADADLAGAQLATHDSVGHPVQVPVDLTRVLAGEQDRPLQQGDVLSVPGVKGYVYVSGYVNRPGRYPYRPEWTVNDYLGEAGGPAPGGSRDRVTILGLGGRQRESDRRMPLQRGETVFVDRSLGAKGATALGLLINVTALAVSVVAISRTH
jgi:protein involved in polysaccharide export with SLBB domain